MGRRKSALDDLFNVLFELTGFFWQVGAVITAILSVITVKSLFWVIDFNSVNSTGNAATLAIVESIGWVFYLLPVVLLILTVLFGIKTISVYDKQKCI